MSQSKMAYTGNGQRPPTPNPETSKPGAALQRAVSDRPWLFVGAAAGVGLTLGLQSRRFVESRAAGMFFATLGGIAMRVATKALVESFQSQQK